MVAYVTNYTFKTNKKYKKYVITNVKTVNLFIFHQEYEQSLLYTHILTQGEKPTTYSSIKKQLAQTCGRASPVNLI